MALSYPLAKDILTDVEKERIVCTYLNATDTNAIEWDKAAAAYGSASVESYKKGMQNSLKKIKKAMDDGVQPAEGSTPAKAANNKRGRKRKEKAASAVVESEGEDAVVEDAPPKKKAKAKAKAAPKKSKAVLKAEAEAAALAEADEDEVVKSEGDAEE